jgi:hypothetical protein
MKCRRLRLSCPCGRIARQFTAIGFSADCQLVISWRCSHCKNWVHYVKPLADCLRQCPTDIDALLEALDSASGVDADDVKFLHSLGVRYSGDADA